ncbi:MAG: hypothetical protein H3C39_04220 [Flavobacteriia bacterium]|nr:hypothetical protein [Flavobacteriia bacterium]
MSAKKNNGFIRIILPLLLIVAGLLMISGQFLSGLFSQAELEAKIEPNSVIMPAAYKVYGNGDALEGKYGLFKMLLTNNGKSAARNVKVSFEIPGYITETDLKKVPVILPGQSILVNCFPKFKEDIVDKRTSSRETVNINISGLNIKDQTESFPVEIKGRNEFVYTQIPTDEILSPAEMIDNAELISCFVTPEDPIIKYFTQQIQEKLLRGEAASVNREDKEAVRFLTGLYDATYLSHMVYSGTSGVPSAVGDAQSVVQSLRLPREVVTGKTGLCIELSILYASVLMNAGLDPIIFLIPGHAYPGFRLNGNFYAIEATGIGGEGMEGGRMNSMAALQMGMKELETFFQSAMMGDERYMIVDIRESIKNGAVAMELKDDSFLRGKVDEIARSFGGGMAYNPQPQVSYTNYENPGGTNTGGGNSGGSSPAAPSGYKNYKGTISFAYPSSWRIKSNNGSSMPQLKKVLSSQNSDTFVEIYDFKGVSSAQAALNQIQQYLMSFGGNLQYSPAGESNGFQLFSGQSNFENILLQWVAVFKRTSSGYSAAIVGTNASNPSQGVVENILNTIH